MKGIQVIGILVIGYLVFQTLSQYKKGNYSSRKTFLWVALWVLIGSLFAFPPLVELMLPIFTMQNMMLTTLVVGLIATLVLVYHAYQQLAQVERKLTKLVQNLAIRDYVNETLDDPDEKDDER